MGFQDAVTDAIIQKVSTGTTLVQNMHEIIYASTETDTPIRRLTVDIEAWCWDPSILKALEIDAT